MIFSLPFWVVSAFANFVKLILRVFVGAILTFYVKYSQDQYASSIRWSRTGGLLEMIQLFWYSKKKFVPGKSRAVLFFAMVASFGTVFISGLLTLMVSRADMEVNSVAARAFTAQLISTDPSFWNVYMGAESTMEESLTAMLSDTRRNPNPRLRTRYTPRTYNYETGCSGSTALITKDFNSSFLFPPAPVMCKHYIMALKNKAYDWDPKTASARAIDSSTFMVITPVVNLYSSQLTQTMQPTFGAYERRFCFGTTTPPQLDVLSEDFPEDGIVALPKTLTTKCQFGSDGSLVLSVTYFQFAIGHMQDFDRITASILDNPTSLPLLKPMYAAVNNGTFLSPTNNSTVVMLTKTSSAASDVDFFGCMSMYSKTRRDMGLLCTYMLTSVISVKPQVMDPTIAADLKREPVHHPITNTTNQIDFTIFHLPHAPELENRQGTAPLFSSAHLVKATADATRYLASLGHNVNMYKDSGSILDQLYIIYDAVELKDAYEVSTIGFAVVCAVTGLCGLACVFSEYPKLFPTVYNSSLYKVIYKELKSEDESMPMLMHCTQDPLAFHGNQVVPDPDDQSYVAIITSSQDNHPMVLLQDGNNAPKQQEQLHQMLGDIPTQPLLLDTRRITASRPTMASANPTTTTMSTSWHPQTIQLQSLGSNLGVPPPIPARPSWIARGTPPTLSAQASPHGATTHGEHQTSAPSAHQGPTLIQSPFI